MEWMFRSIWLLPVLSASLVSAQSTARKPSDLFQQAPADVEDALRARITEFYQDHVDGKFRLAEKLVAEDSKDFFYSANKPKYLSFQIQSIRYSENYTRAKATVVCETFVAVPGFMDKPLKVPVPSYWKVENGKWCWYVDQASLNRTPFGTMKASSDGTGHGALPTLPDQDAAMAMVRKVNADRKALELHPGSSGNVRVTNHMPGPVTLRLVKPPAEWLQAALDRTSLKAGETAVLTVKAMPDAKPLPRPAMVQVEVVQTNVRIPVEVSVK